MLVLVIMLVLEFVLQRLLLVVYSLPFSGSVV